LVAPPPLDPGFAAPAPVFGDFAEPEAARGAAEGLAELAVPAAGAAAAGLPGVVPVSPAGVEPAMSGAAAEAVVSGPGTFAGAPAAG
jgi:hypothetical protein